jgi:HlyD family type I secretion membrane fusion protein
MMAQQKMKGEHAGQMAGGGPAKQKWLSKLTPKNIFVAILKSMQNSVKFIDQFVNLVVKKDGGNADDVVKNARSPILFGAFVTFFFVIIGGIWAATAPLDSAAVASGTVISSSQKKIINHQDGGIIKTVFVKVGDHVSKGDNLLELDDTKARSQRDNSLNKYRSSLATESRLFAEIRGEDKITFPEVLLKDKDDVEVARIIQTQNNFFESKRDQYYAEKDSLRQKIKQLEKQIEGNDARKEAHQKHLEVTRDRLDATRKLNKQGYANKSSLLELESKEAGLLSDIAVSEAETARLEQEIIKTNIDLLNIDSNYSTKA